ncbi:dTDP-4-dehydrorhamnose 3,5-epimerase [Hyphomicrobium sp.]|uniref:dTDP-4-dehydrorhamnose 3,5-epimerase n=1 Tax=Hyphomicrobium sp. TaxID=82 RepID=UPI0025C6456C|nr:dTDP-4-dehydrorhamnose 3,5-epimerase [Hyphomicrobium sp.]MCC7251816.1 dTDP-4-dehydrorhamnose 3,5-epimerase [Hyphomicrobium sp.]
MRFTPTAVAGAFVVELDGHVDARGMFARAFCADTFAAQGLASVYPHCNLSHNHKRGTLRGLHYQAEPKSEAKLVRAIRGRVFDVALDLRPESVTYLRWAGVELDAAKRNALYVPPGCAHGFLTLEDDCEVFYQVSEVYAPELDRGVRFDDPAFGIDWPFAPSVISTRDMAHAPYRPMALV